MNNRERAEQILARLDELDHSGTKGMKWGYNKGKPNGKRKAEGEKDEKSLGNAVGNAIAKNVKPFADAFGLVADKIVQGLKEKADDNWLIPYGKHQYNRLPGSSKDWTSEAGKKDALAKVNHGAREWIQDYSTTEDGYLIVTAQRLSNETDEQFYDRVNQQFTSYYNNCTNCAFAFELRMRGYDVEAQPIWKLATQGLIYDRMEDDNANSAPFVDENGKSPTFGLVHAGYGFSYDDLSAQGLESAKKVREEFLSEYEDGARGFFTYDWINGGGHINNWVVEDGDVWVYDAQIGEKKSLEDVFSRAKNVFSCRVDDCTAVETQEDAVSSYAELYNGDTWKKEGKRR